jgi:choline dehydrogenase-like flavoprotein
MTTRRLATLRRVVDAFVPRDARAERVLTLAVAAIDGLTPARRREMEQLLDLLSLPAMFGGEALARTLWAMADIPVPMLRSGFAALKRLTLFLAYAESDGDANPTWARLGYPGPRHDGVVETPLTLSTARDGERVEADVVVIGSGAGGGVAAASFALAGLRVAVLEAGGAGDPSTQREMSMRDMYLDSGLTATKDLGISILAGATLGGGTTVNWCTSLRLDPRVAAEWDAASHIDGLSDELAHAYADVEAALGVAPIAQHNRNNQTIIDGCAKLGVHAAAMPRNAPTDCGAGCGYCGFGCAYAKKRSTVRAMLPAVIGAGGAVYVGARADRVLFDGTRARGVAVTQTVAPGDVRTFEVAAKRVVVAGGALRTPGILARSGVHHHLLGQRLFLHPVAAMIGEFDEPIDAFSGPMQSAYSDAYNYLHGTAYGVKLEVAPTHPGVAALATPWTGRDAHAALLSDYRKCATMIAVARDHSPGSISLDDEATISYQLSPYDGANLLEGSVGMADVLFAAGAARVRTLHNRPQTLIVEREHWDERERDAFARRIASIGMESNRQILFSAHQMGTAAISGTRSHGVVDPDGNVWGYEGLTVVDASLFPLASGVNPMLTITAMAARIAAKHGGAPLASVSVGV